MAKLIDDSVGPVGGLMSAMLTEAQFQAIYGTGWVLMDGRSVAGSKYASMTGNNSIPDARGLVLRGKNNGRGDGAQNPDGDLALGTFQNDAMQGHAHRSSNAYAGNPGGGANAGGSFLTLSQVTVDQLISDGANGTPRTASESRMKNVTVNHFIRIN